jgi:hypothetical protein
MSFRKPITTFGGLTWWNNIRQNEYFIMQEHRVGIPIWPYKYRILMRENRMEIANSNDLSEIESDWTYLKSHAVPRLEEAIDLSQINPLPIVMGVINKFL